jgi:hypothetical protein
MNGTSHEKGSAPGSPATPPHPPRRAPYGERWEFVHELQVPGVAIAPRWKAPLPREPPARDVPSPARHFFSAIFVTPSIDTAAIRR